MSGYTLFSVIESPTHPDFSRLYRKLRITEVRLNSLRKTITAMKKQPPDWIVAEFFYGYGNNYAGVNVSNLDVLLASQRKLAPAARTLILVNKAELEHVDKLTALFPVERVLVQPVTEAQMESALSGEAGETAE